MPQERAWRWRFGRRWAAEQAKGLNPLHGRDPEDDEDTWDEALQFLGTGGAANMQVQYSTVYRIVLYCVLPCTVLYTALSHISTACPTPSTTSLDMLLRTNSTPEGLGDT